MDGQTNLPIGQQTPPPAKEQSIEDIDFFATEDVSPQGDAGTKQGTAPNKLKVKYNGTEQEFDLATQTEEVTALIQKGMNYDHVKGEVDSYKNSEEMTFLKQMATQAGMPDTKAFIQKLQKDIEIQETQARAQQLVAEGMSAKHAQYTAELEMKAKQVVAPPTPPPDMTDALKTGFQELFSEYPDAQQFKTFGELPLEVQDAINAGKSPLVAYQRHLLAQKEAKQALDKHNQDVKSRDLGSMKTGQQIDTEDPFLAGLFGKR
jgi:hypothetical protein